jgi:hypothetical protein
MRVRSLFVAAILPAVLAALLTSGCGGSTIAPSTTLNLAGTWSGTLIKVSGAATPVTWTATQNGSIATGALVVLVGAAKTPITGTMTGTVSGMQVSLTVTVPPGAFAAFGFPTCSSSGTGTSSTATTSSLVATVTITNAPPACVGTAFDVASEVDQLSLSK